MDKRTFTNTVKMCATPGEIIERDLLRWHYRYFKSTSRDEKIKILGEDAVLLLGEAQKLSWDKTVDLFATGNKSVETFHGFTMKKRFESRAQRKWNHLIPDTKPKEECIAIFKDIVQGGKIG